MSSRIDTRFSACFSVSLCIAVFLAGHPNRLIAQQIDRKVLTGASVLPDTTIAYLEISDPARLFGKLAEHPLSDAFEKLTFVKEALGNPDFKPLPVVVALIEARTKTKWPQLLKTLTGKGVYVGVDSSSDGGALLIHSQSKMLLSQTVGILLGLMESDAKSKGNEVPFTIGEYRGHKIAEMEQGVLSRIDDWLVFSNRKELVKKIADNLIDGAQMALADSKNYQSAAGRDRDSDVWTYVDTRKLRERGVAPQLLNGKTDNAGVELLVGGILDALNSASQTVLTAKLEDDSLSITASAPRDSNLKDSNRAFFFGENGLASAPAGLSVENSLLDITAYRDVAAWWNSKENLFEENVVAQLALADSQLSTLFAGLSFGDEILGGLQPGFQIVAKQQEYSKDYQPQIQLPSFAIVSRLSDAKLQRRLRISWQSLIGFANIQLGMQGQPQLESKSESVDGGRIDSTRYMMDDESPNGLLLYNFSPTLVFVDDYMIISSTQTLANELLESARNRNAEKIANAENGSRINTQIAADGDQLHRILETNRAALVSQNMLEKGSSRSDAEQTIGGVLEVAALIRQAHLSLSDQNGNLNLNFRLDFKSDK